MTHSPVKKRCHQTTPHTIKKSLIKEVWLTKQSPELSTATSLISQQSSVSEQDCQLAATWPFAEGFKTGICNGSPRLQHDVYMILNVAGRASCGPGLLYVSLNCGGLEPKPTVSLWWSWCRLHSGSVNSSSPLSEPQCNVVSVRQTSEAL